MRVGKGLGRLAYYDLNDHNLRSAGEIAMADGTWSVAQAKARFSELIEKATAEGPQHVTRHGRDAVVVVSAADWREHSRPARSVIDVLLDPSARGLLAPGEAAVFERDRTDDRSPPTF